ncbi:YnbE family lipoprotein [bacterium]|nr:YnbE family lipoprotein [bacterium]
MPTTRNYGNQATPPGTLNKAYRSNSTVRKNNPTHNRILSVVLLAALLSACTPTVRVEAPKEPIVINMNINISHEIRVKVDKDLENLLEKKDDIF